MKVIVESGATKADWCILDGNDSVELKSAGMNLASSSVSVESIVGGMAGEMPAGTVTEIWFYAAGLICREGESVPQSARELDAVLHRHFPEAKIEYASDLLAAARAVCGHDRGVAAILGTGSNSCLYDGEAIVQNIRSAGFILGDEGGAACLGKLFMADFLKGLVPEDVAADFASEFDTDYMTVVQNVYRSAAPSAYLGSFAPWILSRYESSEYVRSLVEGNFRSFIERALVRYPLEGCRIGVVGSFGYAYREILCKVAEEYGITFSSIIKAPLEGLKIYHQ